ncbi:MAG: aminopeptidase P family protein [Firmicutes bacterium]|nr:aminopeptidase P family protein [Bacillota bacterium]
MDHLQRVRQLMEEEELEALFICQPENRRYVSGFTGTSAYLLITEEEALLLTDFRYVEQAKTQAPAFTIVQHGNPALPEIARQVQRLGISHLGFETEFINVATYQALKELLPQSQLVAADALLIRARAVKDAAELEALQIACTIADQAFQAALDVLRPGITEREIAWTLERTMREAGASGLSFDTIVASGQRGSMPHGVASSKTIVSGECVTLDFGCIYDGYCSDETRTVAVGHPPEQLVEIYSIVKEAQEAALQAAQPGISGRELDAVARKIIAAHGFGDAFGHSLGHGVGLAVHEAPSIAPNSEWILQENMVVTDEPGIYLPGIGGVRIEDDLLITAEGAKRLTRAPRELLIL